MEPKKGMPGYAVIQIVGNELIPWIGIKGEPYEPINNLDILAVSVNLL